MTRFIDELKRTHTCGELRLTDADSEAVLMGWVQRQHDRGGVIFVDLRDRDGLTQVTFDKQVSAEAFETASKLRSEYVIAVRGKVRDRGEQRNDKVPTGAVEVLAQEVEILNTAETPIFPIQDDVNATEETRLKYRYLDLRRPTLQKNLKTRAKAYYEIRNHFAENGFLEVETPFMVKYTPGGARNFLVPSRMHAGKFYAMAESPQLFKQLLMVAGYDKYFQITRCFRDEDLRGPRAQTTKSSGHIGRPKKKPWTSSQPCSRRNASCSSVSTPSATMVAPSACPSAMTAPVMAALVFFSQTCETKERSILMTSMGKLAR